MFLPSCPEISFDTYLFSVCNNNKAVFFSLSSLLENANCTLICVTGPSRMNFRCKTDSPLKSAPFSTTAREITLIIYATREHSSCCGQNFYLGRNILRNTTYARSRIYSLLFGNLRYKFPDFYTDVDRILGDSRPVCPRYLKNKNIVRYSRVTPRIIVVTFSRT